MNGSYLIHAAVISFLCIVLWHLTFMQFVSEVNECDMTYMYEIPEYSLMPVKESNNSSYRLYLYGEGAYFQHVRRGNLQGIPVIFIPGHGGSYKQARSLGSVLLRKSLKSGRSNHFNVFSIDFNEEWVALSGETLNQQVQFLHLAIKSVLSLYESSQFKPQSVILVGHSIGGVVARALFMLEGFDCNAVSVLLTFASPNLAPVLSLDYKIGSFYDEVNQFWKINAESLLNVSVLSVSGGDQDIQVRHSLTRLADQQDNQLSTSLMVIPGVHLTTDHQAIVWCKQLVLTTSRFLFSLINDQSKQVTEVVEKRHHLMKYYFGDSFRSVKHSLHINSKVKLFSAYTKKSVTQLHWSVQHPKSEVGFYYSFAIDHYLKLNASTFVGRISSSYNRWILVCSAHDSSHAIDLSSHAHDVVQGKLLRLDLNLLHKEGFSYIVIRIPPHLTETLLEVNVVSPNDHFNFTVPSIFSNLWTFNKGSNFTLSSPSSTPRFYYRVTLGGFSDIYQSFTVNLNDDQGCLEFDTSWDDGMSRRGGHSMKVKLDYSPPDNHYVILHVYSNTTYPSISIRSEFMEGFIQIFRHYFTALPVFVLVIHFLVYSYQMKQLVDGRQCPCISTSLFGGAKPYKIQPFVSLIHFLYRFDWFVLVLTSVGFPLPDSILLNKSHRVWFAFCPFVLFFVAFEFYFLLMLLQRLCNFLLIGLMKFFPIEFFLSLYDARFVRAFVHSIVLAVLIPVSCSHALFYIYATSLANACYLMRIGQSQTNGESGFHGPLRIVLSQIWLSLFLCSASSSAIVTEWTFLSAPFFGETMLAAVAFLLQTLTDNGKQTWTYKRITWLHLPIVIGLVTTSTYSLHRTPIFILLFIVLHTFISV